jgi:hypothetical protein
MSKATAETPGANRRSSESPGGLFWPIAPVGFVLCPAAA